jgi:hypothetical protein
MLANEQMPAAMNRQATLLLSCLGLHEPHVQPANASQIASASAASFFCRFT